MGFTTKKYEVRSILPQAGIFRKNRRLTLLDFELESASRPLCEFWRIDDQQLEVYPFVESFVEYHIGKRQYELCIKIYMANNKEKVKSHKDP
jgi:hypothetical protein